MSSVIGRKKLFASCSDSSDSESFELYKFEEKSTASNKNIHCSNSYDFWNTEEGFKDFHSVHEPSVCYFHFVDELNSALNLKLPDFSFESLCKELRNLLQNSIHCSVFEINKTIQSCYKAIQNFEDFGIKEGNVFIGKLGFNLLFDDEYPGFGDKREVAENFMAVQLKSSKERELLNFAKEFCSELELKMMDSYQESFETFQPSITWKNCNFLNVLANYQMRKASLESYSMEEKIEKTNAKIKILKVKLEKKINDLKSKEEKIILKFSQLEVEKQKVFLEKTELLSSLEEIKLKENKIKQFQAYVKEFLANLPTKSEINSDHFATSSSEIVETPEAERRILENNLEDLKNKLFLGRPEEKDAILTSITFIENRLDGIASDGENHHTKTTPVPDKIKRSMSIKQDCLVNNSKLLKSKEYQVAFSPILGHNRNSSSSGYNRFNGHYHNKVSPHETKNKINANLKKSKRFISPVRATPLLNQQAVNFEFEENGGFSTKNCIELKEIKSNQKISSIKVNSAKSSPNKNCNKEKLDFVKRVGEKAGIRMEDIAKKENLIESKLEELDRKEELYIKKVKELNEKAKILDFEKDNFEIEKFNWSKRVENLKKCMQEIL